MKRTLALLAATVLLTAGCGGSDDATDELQSQPSPGVCAPSGKGTTDLTKKPEPAYAKQGDAPTKTVVHDIVCGTGDPVAEGDKVEVKYVGVLFKDGKEFDSSWSRGDDETLPVKVGTGVIPGFSTGIEGMKPGGRREVVIPPAEGYGDQESGPIPAGSTLVFVIDLVKVVPPPTPVPCTPSGTGPTDLTKKPVLPAQTGPEPKTTQVVDVVCGTGEQADDGDMVEVKYLGVLFKGGKEFDSSWSRGNDETLPFTVGQGVIQGFTTGVTGMKVGGRRIVTIPASEGYGASAQGSIPPNSTLVFVIDLVKVG